MAITFIEEPKAKSNITFLEETKQSAPQNESDGLLGMFGKKQSMLDVAMSGMGAAPFILKHEELIPLLGQIGGGAMAGYPGSVGGATAGNSLKQGIEMLKGKRKSFSVGEVGSEAALTAAFEGVFRLPAFVAYKRLRAADNLANGAGAELALAKGALSKIKDAAPIDDILKPLEDGLNSVAVKNGPQASMLTKWKLKLNGLKDAGETHIDGDTILQMESQIGAAARYKAPNIFGVELSPNLANPKANLIAKDMRAKVSQIVDDFAVRNGLESFPKLSKTVSKLKSISEPGSKTLTDLMTNLGQRGVISGGLGTAVGLATHNPALGLATTAGVVGITDPIARKYAFNALEKTGVGRAATLGATQVARNLLND